MSVYEVDTTCPFCGRANQAMTEYNPNDVAPSIGDISLCFECGEPGIIDFNANGRLVVVPPGEALARELAADPKIQEAMARRREILDAEGI